MAAEVIKITILDHDLERIHACEKSICQALKDIGLRLITIGILPLPGMVILGFQLVSLQSQEITISGV